MPWTEVIYYAGWDGVAPVVVWLEALRRTDPAAYANCEAALERLGAVGHELRRPHAATLGDGVYELRVRKGHVHYRILYFFSGRNQVVMLHALTKTNVVPAADIKRALERRRAFLEAPAKHAYEEDTDG